MKSKQCKYSVCLKLDEFESITLTIEDYLDSSMSDEDCLVHLRSRLLYWFSNSYEYSYEEFSVARQFGSNHNQ